MQVLAIAPAGPGNNIEKFVGKKGEFPFPLMTDPTHEIFDRYDVAKKLLSLGQRPALFVFDAGGRVAYNQVGTQQTDIPAIDEVLAVIDSLDGRAP